MSAFIVNKEHIDALISYMISERISYWTGTDRVTVTSSNAEEVGRILLDENVRSVTYRYRDECSNDEKNESAAYRFSYDPRPRKTVAIIKAVHCLKYQCCETDDWKSTLAYRICETIISHACHRLPGYDEADWGIFTNKSNAA